MRRCRSIMRWCRSIMRRWYVDRLLYVLFLSKKQLFLLLLTLFLSPLLCLFDSMNVGCQRVLVTATINIIASMLIMLVCSNTYLYGDHYYPCLMKASPVALPFHIPVCGLRNCGTERYKENNFKSGQSIGLVLKGHNSAKNHFFGTVATLFWYYTLWTIRIDKLLIFEKFDTSVEKNYHVPNSPKNLDLQ